MKKIYFAALAAMFIISCSNEEILNVEMPVVATTRGDMGLSKEDCIKEFAKILSKVVYENQDVRSFLKDEAIKQFDNNYDILYLLVKDSQIGESTFRDLLVSSSSEELISEIEEKVPLLNIVIPPMPFSEISAETMDVTDKDIPVVVNTEKGNMLYYQGELDEVLENGSVPAFNVFVVNENVRVVINSQSCGSPRKAKKKGGYNMISFKSEVFNGMKKTRSVQIPASIMSRFLKAGNAYQAGFNQNDGSNRQKALQRDYIYYGITPTNTQGSLNMSVSEYIDIISIDPKAYYKLSDVSSDGDQTNIEDPYMQYNGETYKRGGALTEQEVIDKIWTKGAYSFKFELITSNGSPIVGYASVYPKDIWNFNIEETYVSGSFWQHSKRYYRMDPSKFTKKDYVLPNPICLGKWNIGKESIQRWIHIVEEDAGTECSYQKTYEFTKLISSKITVNDKTELGCGNTSNSSNEISTGVETSDTKTSKSSTNVTFHKTDKDDDLGQAELYFYEPIVEGNSSTQGPLIKTHSTGIVEFTITAR